MCIDNSTLKILLIEDNPDEAELIKDVIGEVIETPVIVTHYSYLRDGLLCLETSAYDIVLLDIRLPDNEDLSSIEQIKQQNPHLPIVVLTSLKDKETAIEAVRRGAQDYLYKGQFEWEFLGRSIRYAIERQRIEDELKKQKEELQRQIEREKLIARMIERIRQSLELRNILETTVKEVRQFLKADRVMIYNCRNQEMTRIVAESPEKENPSPILFDTLMQTLENNDIDQLFREGSQEQIQTLLNSLVQSVITVPIWQNKPEQEKPLLWGQLIAQDYQGNRTWQTWEQEFLTQLGNSVAIAIQQSELYKTVERQANLDGLTEIANRRQFDQFLKKEWERLISQQKTAKFPNPISLILCDVDFFKAYNDRYGHLGGDDCLKKVAKILAKGSQRASDLAARFGGEEFAIILSDTDAEGALKVANHIQDLLAQEKIPHRDSSVNEYVTISMGIATQIPTPENTPISLIKLADQALREAKAEGRNRIIQYLIES